jgi:hypothetical protein
MMKPRETGVVTALRIGPVTRVVTDLTLWSHSTSAIDERPPVSLSTVDVCPCGVDKASGIPPPPSQRLLLSGGAGLALAAGGRSMPSFFMRDWSVLG